MLYIWYRNLKSIDDPNLLTLFVYPTNSYNSFFSSSSRNDISVTFIQHLEAILSRRWQLLPRSSVNGPEILALSLVISGWEENQWNGLYFCRGKEYSIGDGSSRSSMKRIYGEAGLGRDRNMIRTSMNYCI